MSVAVGVERSGHIAVVTINRPEARNAINPEVARGLAGAFTEIERDPDIWISILTGAGDIAFCAGADLKAVAAGLVDQLSVAPGGFGGFVQFPREKPVIAAVNGIAVAGGCELVLASDLTVATEHATFGLPEVTRGIIAAAGGVFRLPLRIPHAIAIELILTGDQISASEALQWGLINRVVPAGSSLGAAEDLAMRICRNGPLAVRESLAVARKARDLTEATAWDVMLAARRRVFATNDATEGPLAFIEKRDPVWTAT